jgi:outer membrane receptor protein involved in Fe transport
VARQYRFDVVYQGFGHFRARLRLDPAIKPPRVAGDKFARVAKGLIASILIIPGALADNFFERELALSALEQLRERGIHNELLSAYLYDSSVDTALSIEEMPINLPINGQGQGYINTSFLIEELINTDVSRRGPYYAEDGDFATAGSLDLQYEEVPGQHQLTLGIGEDSFYHAVANGAVDWGDFRLTYGVESIGQDTDPDLRNSSAANGSDNAAFKLEHGDSLSGFKLNFMAHQADWKSESPKTIDPSSIDDVNADNLLDAFALEDSHRYSLSGSGWQGDSKRRWKYSAYAIDYSSQLDLEFLLIDSRKIRINPIERKDDRIIYGGTLSHDWFFTRTGHHQIAVEARLDALQDVGLSDVKTEENERNNGDADLYTTGFYYRNQYQWSNWLRHEFGLRLDYLHINPDSGLELDYKDNSDQRWSPKFSLIANPWDHTELFLQAGRGIQSNDARYSYRGINAQRSSINPPRKVRALGAVDGLDIGFSTRLFDDAAVLSASYWYREDEYDLAARNAQVELRRSERDGVEFRFIYQPSERWYVDMAATVSKARFTDDDPNGDHIPGSTEEIATLAFGYLGDRFYVNVDALYLGPSPFLEDNSAETDSVTSVDLYVGGNISQRLTMELQWLNIADNSRTNSDVSFIDRVAAAEAFVAELYYNPVPARTVRLYFRYFW